MIVEMREYTLAPGKVPAFDDRTTRRPLLQAEAGWQSYVQQARPLILAQTNRILNPAPFFTPE
jgi:hypothetical protein